MDGITFKRRFLRPDAESRFLEECRRAGVQGVPASHGDVFHRLFRFPNPVRDIHAELDAPLVGGWDGPLRTGPQPGRWKILDIVSAYCWAALQGLPEVWSARPSSKPERGGIYVAMFKADGVILPPHLRLAAERRKPALLSFEEMAAYNLRSVRVRSGVCFRQWRGLDAEVSLIRRRFTDSKAILRAFWGRWASDSPVTSLLLRYGVPIKSWQTVARTRNVAWAHTILSRVKIRVAELARHACLVNTDCVAVPADLPVKTGADIGDWRVKGYISDMNLKASGVAA